MRKNAYRKERIMSIFKLLDCLIWEMSGDDEVLHAKLVSECRKHINGDLEFEDMSDDAKICIRQWEIDLQTTKQL